MNIYMDFIGRYGFKIAEQSGVKLNDWRMNNGNVKVVTIRQH